MNPDPNSIDNGNEARFEKWLRATPQPELPPDWRAAILKSAAPPVWPWFIRPVRWGLAACWGVIALFQLTTPPMPEPPPSGHFASPLPPPPPIPRDWLADLNDADVNPDFPLP
jgi:hypothetical protein